MKVLCNNAHNCTYNSTYNDYKSICYHRIVHTHNLAGDKTPCGCYCHRLNIEIKCVSYQNIIRKKKLKQLNEINLQGS